MLALCISRTSACTTSDIGGLNSGSGYRNHQTVGLSLNKIDWANHANYLEPTWTHKAMMSAKRERDFAGYMPFKAGSTIFAKASISWSWGVAHLTRDCSDRTLELESNFKWEGKWKAHGNCQHIINQKETQNWKKEKRMNSGRRIYLSNGFRPVNSSNITTPKLYTSLFTV